MPQDIKITPFSLHIPDAAIADLRERLARTRWPDELASEPWEYGASLTEMRRITAYWAATFDWRRAEAGINRFAQFIAEIDHQQIHFLHARSGKKSALPLLMSHGWPGSFVEMLDIIPLLTHPEDFGGAAADAFDVIVPSLPGFGFSSPPRRPGMTPRRMAFLFARLMTALGAESYGVQGGDWGATISTWMARDFAGQVRGIHLNWLPGSYRPPLAEDEADYSAPECAFLAKMQFEAASGVSTHVGIHGTRPQTLGYGLNDSPAGLAAWLLDKFRMIADCGGDIETAIPLDRLLTNISIYWFAGNITAAIRLYKEARAEPLVFRPGERILPPLGFAAFPGEVAVPPRLWASRVFDVQHWTAMKKGGHFAAMEQPAALAEDIRSFFRNLR